MIEAIPYPIFETESFAEGSVMSSMVDEVGNRRASFHLPKRSKNMRKDVFLMTDIDDVKELAGELE